MLAESEHGPCPAGKSQENVLKPLAPSFTLGISAYYHDSAAALLKNDEIVAAAQEERFSRKKFDADFPAQSIRSCLQQAGIGLLDLQEIVFYDKPFLKFDRLLETYLAFAPRGYWSFQKSLPVWLKEKLFLKSELLNALTDLLPKDQRRTGRSALRERLRFSEHHLSHAASAFYPSPFQEAAVLVLDGVGEWATASVFHGEGRNLKALQEIHFPHSLGLLYSAFTSYCGFKVNSGEYKLMGLAPYGKPTYADLIRKNLIDIFPDGSFQLNMDYFSYCTNLKMTNGKFEKLFGGKARQDEEPLSDRHKNLAASIQLITEEILLKMTRQISRDLPTHNLCLAGGVALNCVANSKILEDGQFKNIWIQPAAGDAGGALGAAYVGYHLSQKNERKPAKGDAMQGAFLGPAFSNSQIAAELTRLKARFHAFSTEEILERTVQLLSEEKAVAWFQGRMEFGPRSLGARSVLADPRAATMQSRLNLKIKFRESFRPFAPAVRREDLAEWFRLEVDSPYMLLVAKVGKHNIPAVTHVDQSARVQTVHQETNPLFHRLLSRFKEQTGCPILVNTSFNVRGEPIAQSPADAFRCFMGTHLDALVIGDFLLLKEEQDLSLQNFYYTQQEKD